MYMHWKKFTCKWIQTHVVQRPIVVGLISTTSLLFSFCCLCSLFLSLASTPFCRLWYLIEHFICLHFILSQHIGYIKKKKALFSGFLRVYNTYVLQLIQVHFQIMQYDFIDNVSTLQEQNNSNSFLISLLSLLSISLPMNKHAEAHIYISIYN